MKHVTSIPTKFESVVKHRRREKDGFSTRTKRFEDRQHYGVSGLPGPGYYSSVGKSDNFQKNSTSISKRGYGALAARDSRFSVLSKGFNPPGPGNYRMSDVSQRKGKKHMNRIHGTSGFVRRQNRSLNIFHTEDASTPGPGSYGSIYNSNKKKRRVGSVTDSAILTVKRKKMELEEQKRIVLYNNWERKMKVIRAKQRKFAKRVPGGSFFFRSTTNRMKPKRKKGGLRKINKDSERYFMEKIGNTDFRRNELRREKSSLLRAKQTRIIKNNPSKYFSKKKNESVKDQPGPGEYYPFIHEEKAKFLPGGSSAVFTSTSRRFTYQGKTTKRKRELNKFDYYQDQGFDKFEKKNFHYNISKKWL